MNIRDREIARILLYAKGLGLRVRIANYAHNEAGDWGHDPIAEITINKRVHTTKTELILTLLHELGHAVYFAYTKQPIPKAAYESGPHTKKARRKLYEYEAAGIAYMSNLYTELQLGIPLWKVKRAMEQDTWAYEVYMLTGEFPSKTERKEKYKSLTVKYKETL
jgi:hypothetical protein